MENVRGFTPAFDAVIQNPDGAGNPDPLAALVYGKVWRYEKRYGVCRAAVARLARELGVSEKTVQRKLADLIGGGWIEKTTPERQGFPHDYKTTGKTEIVVVAETSETPDSKSYPPKTSDSKTDPRQSESPNPSDSESDIDTKRDKIETNNAESVPSSAVDASGKAFDLDLLPLLEAIGAGSPPTTSEVHRARALRAMRAGAERHAGEPDSSWLPEPVLDLGRAFLAGFPFPPATKSGKGQWIKELGEFARMGVTSDDLTAVLDKHRGAGLSIKSPGSLRTGILNARLPKAEATTSTPTKEF